MQDKMYEQVSFLGTLVIGWDINHRFRWLLGSDVAYGFILSIILHHPSETA